MLERIILVMFPMLIKARVIAGSIRWAVVSTNMVKFPAKRVSRIGIPVIGGLIPAGYCRAKSGS